MNKHITLSFLAWLAAIFVGAAGIYGLWPSPQSKVLLAIEIITLIILLFNSASITCWVYKHTKNKQQRYIALLCIASLVLCICGDVVNFNLNNQYYRYNEVIKHDYLADSVWFFVPGYSLLFIAVLLASRSLVMYPLYYVAAYLGGTLLISLLCFYFMHIPEAGYYVLLLTGLHSFVITSVGLMSLVLLNTYRRLNAPLGVWLVSLGLVLAAIADALIGLYWIYGNSGEGYFPQIRYINWIIYISSQCLVIHLAKINITYKLG